MRPTVHDEDGEKVTEIADHHMRMDAEAVPFAQRLKVVLELAEEEHNRKVDRRHQL